MSDLVDGPEGARGTRARVSFFLRGRLSEHRRARNFVSAFHADGHEIKLFHFGEPLGRAGFDQVDIPNDTFARTPTLRNFLARLRFVCAGLGLGGGYSGRVFVGPFIRAIRGSLPNDGRPSIAFVSDIFYLPAIIQAAVFDIVILDAREYYPEQMGSSKVFRLFRQPEIIRVCRRYLSQTDVVLSVSEGISKLYSKSFGVSPLVIRSALAEHEKVAASAPSLPSDVLRIVYMGVANRNRGLDRFLEALVRSNTSHQIHLYLTGKLTDIRFLKKKFAEEPRVFFETPVSPSLMLDTMTNYDLGLSYFPPTTENLRFGLGNKFFQYLGAGIPVLVGPTPEMAAIVRKYDCGLVVQSFDREALTEFFRGLSISNVKAKLPGVARANSRLSFENEVAKLMKLIDLDSA